MENPKISRNPIARIKESIIPLIGLKDFLYANKFEGLFLLAGILLGLIIRYRLFPFASLDFWLDLNNWYEQIRSRGWAALNADFSNYSPLYIYILFFIHALFPSLPNLIAIKIPSVLMDLACAFFAFGLIWSVTKSKLRATFASLAVFFAPTVILNSAYWGQADSIYTALLVACVWFLILKRFNLAMLSYGLALAFKLQSVFVGPLIAALFLIGYIPWKRIILIPIPYLISILPAWIAGRPILQLLMIFWNQAGTYKKLTLNAPSGYAWFFEEQYNLISKAGIFFAMGICLFFVALIFFRKRQIGNRELILLAAVSVFLVPFFLPSMHERYFYLADVFSILLVFCYPDLFLVPIFSQLSSFFVYQPFLTDKTVFPLSVVSFLNLASIVLLTRKMVGVLYPAALQGTNEPSAIPQ
jgi:Gpi18-like mannosyltransferase